MIRAPWIEQPLLGGASLFALGTVFGRPELDPSLIIVSVFFLGIAAVLTFFRRVSSLLGLLAYYFLLGVISSSSITYPKESISNLFSGQIPKEKVILEAKVIEGPNRYPDKDTYIISVRGVGTGPVPTQSLKLGSGEILLSIYGSNLGGKPCAQTGDIIRTYAKLKKPSSSTFPGGISSKDYANSKGVALFASAFGNNYCVALTSVSTSVFQYFRDNIREHIYNILPENEASLVLALTTGNKSEVERETKEALRNVGLSHLTAVSGFHLGLVVSGCMAILFWAAKHSLYLCSTIGAQRAASACCLPLTYIYPVFVGGTSSSIRAGLMAAFVLLGFIFLRRGSVWTTLAIVFLLTSSLDPIRLYEPGFQLSFVAVVALLRASSILLQGDPTVSSKLLKLKHYLRSSIVVSVAATLGTAPISALHFGQVSAIGVAANIIATPLAGLAVPSALIGSLLSFGSPFLAEPFLFIAGKAAYLLKIWAQLLDEVPGRVWRFPAFSFIELTCYYGLLFILSRWRERTSSQTRMAYMMVMVLGLSLAYRHVHRWLQTTTVVTLLPVGQGDGIIAELPGGYVVAIDAGPGYHRTDAGSQIIAPFLRHRGIGTIDLLIVSHPHADHIGGIYGLIKQNIRIKRVWWTGDTREGPKVPLQILSKELFVEPAPWMHQETFGPVTLTVLGPYRAYETYHEVNDASIIVKLSHGKRSMLFMGDAESAAEQEFVQYLSAGIQPQADVLKVGHHGSRSSTTRQFMSAVQPKHALISCGLNNKFRFPHQETLDILQEFGATVWRTDLQGALSVETNGQWLSVKPFLENKEL